jgi:hypothetical protein
MATFTMTIRGDQLGTYTSLNGTGNTSDASGRTVTLSNVEAVGTASDTYTITIEQANGGETEYRNGQFITITDENGDIVVPRTSVQPDDEQGLGAGDQHLILFQQRFFIQLSGVPVGPESVSLNSNIDEVGITTIGDNDGNLDFVDVVTTFPCFAEGTLIDTLNGPKACEALVAGDVVETQNGAETLIWVGQRTLDFSQSAHNDRPVLIKAHTFGKGLPKRDVMVSPQHKILMEGEAVQDLFGCSHVLAPAKGLLDHPGVRWMQGKKRVTYVSMLFAEHQVVRAEGLEMESLYPGPYALRTLGAEMRAEVNGALSESAKLGNAGYGPHAHRALSVREANMLVEKMQSNGDGYNCKRVA